MIKHSSGTCNFTFLKMLLFANNNYTLKYLTKFSQMTSSENPKVTSTSLIKKIVKVIKCDEKTQGVNTKASWFITPQFLE